ncbi:hypothetical protein GVX82_02015 [Patescibacteria group bacterium]|jgi:glutaredoxin|nr:hypothetical protein [Patescibacteria group bacterium]
MLTLYMKTGCPFCEKVRTFTDEHDIAFTEKNIADADVAEELIERGGTRQVPYLVDDTSGVEMYESDDIISYLAQHYVSSGVARDPEEGESGAGAESGA